ncbi:tetratricopeptide repeat protein [Cryomorpha ignava]|uniref:Tetratricopeptide repeat protein n=1 Tax=Cryomorpha ignava TaxID=101383 RepID=A0A7K3WNJ6_9FLAO|nr:tetratricopeptide repeat protein [Cryomorpha ignava]NEN23206.1 tetratricopeptide repeat protein [Cryomorpha ignava]
MVRTISFLTVLLLLSCSNPPAPKQTSQLGVANLEVSGKPEAIADFENGLLLLYSFEYDDAREAFQGALKEDSSMAMAYWGLAMTYNHPLWRTQFTDSAQAVLSLRERRNAKPGSELESDLLSSLDVLYQDGESKEIRDKNYADYFETLNKKYPDNQEVAAFYALSLLGSVADGRDEKTFEKAGKVAAEILKTNPNHPGGLHYVIHAYDDPEHAELAMDAANAYAKVAPEASHALHMPSHIFIAKGMWDKVIASNIDAYEASVERMKRKGLKDGARSFHAYSWLQYAYLQKGNFDEASELLQKMIRYVENDPTKGARSYLAEMKGQYLVDTGDWNQAFAELEVDVSDLNIMANAKCRFHDAMVAFSNKNAKRIDSAITALDDDIRRQTLYLDTVDFKLCLPTQRTAPMPSDIASAKAVSLQMKGIQAWIAGDNNSTEKFLLQAIATADTLSFSYGPPEIQKPVNELYADWLMVQKRYDDAAAQYEKALERAPGRRLSVEGVEKARVTMAVL